MDVGIASEVEEGSAVNLHGKEASEDEDGEKIDDEGVEELAELEGMLMSKEVREEVMGVVMKEDEVGWVVGGMTREGECGGLKDFNEREEHKVAVEGLTFESSKGCNGSSGKKDDLKDGSDICKQKNKIHDL